MTRLGLIGLAFANVCGCAASDDSSTSVGGGGSQDFGAFRETVETGDVPAPDTLDAVGFFHEHHLPLPEPECGQALCLHTEVAVMGNLVNGANCTMLFMGIDTAVDPSELARLPLDIALALDTSGSMAGAPIENLRVGLELLIEDLGPDDRLAIVTFSSDARVVTPLTRRGAPGLEGVPASLVAEGATNVYAGLALAYGELAEERDPKRQRRVVLLSDGEPTAGFESSERNARLAEGYSLEGIPLSVIGVGTEFDPLLLRELASRGTGSSYFLDNPLALREVFVEELRTALLPLAHDVVIDVAVQEGYYVHAVHGVEQSSLSRRGARLEIPTLQVAHRTGAEDNESGRRGGGGILILELMPDEAQTNVTTIPEGEHPVANVEFSYRPTSVTGESGRQTQTTRVNSPLLPGQTPTEGYFPDDSVEKAFVMLNLFSGLRAALEAVQVGDPAAALATLDALNVAVSAWLEQHPDPDIEADLVVLLQLREVIVPLADAQADGSAVAPWTD